MIGYVSMEEEWILLLGGNIDSTDYTTSVSSPCIGMLLDSGAAYHVAPPWFAPLTRL